MIDPTSNPSAQDASSPVDLTDVETVFVKYREVKHAINNTIAVWMALSEMTEKRPEMAEKLTRSVMQRGPDMVQSLHELSQAFLAVLPPEAKEAAKRPLPMKPPVLPSEGFSKD